MPSAFSPRIGFYQHVETANGCLLLRMCHYVVLGGMWHSALFLALMASTPPRDFVCSGPGLGERLDTALARAGINFIARSFVVSLNDFIFMWVQVFHSHVFSGLSILKAHLVLMHR